MKFKVGDRVFCDYDNIEGVVVSVTYHPMFPVLVELGENKLHTRSYTSEGQYHMSSNFFIRPVTKLHKLLRGVDET